MGMRVASHHPRMSRRRGYFLCPFREGMNALPSISHLRDQGKRRRVRLLVLARTISLPLAPPSLSLSLSRARARAR